MSFQELRSRLAAGQHVFLTGSAGTGKSYLTREWLTICQKETLVTATTGVAALNLPDGMTLHSVLRLPVNRYPGLVEWVRESLVTRTAPRTMTAVRRVKEARYLLLDEVSMTPAYLWELADLRCRVWREVPGQPFGGLTVLCVGDFLQLPPVYRAEADPTPHPRCGLYAFESPMWQAMNFYTLNLQVVHRQQHAGFAELCGHLRHGQPLTPGEAIMLRARCVPNTNPQALQVMVRRQEVNRVNLQYLQRLPGPLSTVPFPRECEGSSDDMKKALVADVRQVLYLEHHDVHQQWRVGARVMLVANLRLEDTFAYVNGDRGTILGFVLETTTTTTAALQPAPKHWFPQGQWPVVQFDRTADRRVLVTYHLWERNVTNREGRPLAYTSLRALPLCLAQAATCHKVQGATISGPLAIDCTLMSSIPSAFYVALSRATELENVTLSNFGGPGVCPVKAEDFYQGRYPVSPDEVAKMQRVFDRISDV